MTNRQSIKRQPDARARRYDGKVVDIFVTEGEEGVSAAVILDGREVLGGVGSSKEQVLYTIGVDLGDRKLASEYSSYALAPGWRK